MGGGETPPHPPLITRCRWRRVHVVVCVTLMHEWLELDIQCMKMQAVLPYYCMHVVIVAYCVRVCSLVCWEQQVATAALV